MSKLEKLENELQTAIDTENYEKAARLRDEIQKLKG
jgi:protein-arginine kinase activator protein McsA